MATMRLNMVWSEFVDGLSGSIDVMCACMLWCDVIFGLCRILWLHMCARYIVCFCQGLRIPYSLFLGV